jgi:hypothetical protein
MSGTSLQDIKPSFASGCPRESALRGLRDLQSHVRKTIASRSLADEPLQGFSFPEIRIQPD